MKKLIILFILLTPYVSRADKPIQPAVISNGLIFQGQYFKVCPYKPFKRGCVAFNFDIINNMSGVLKNPNNSLEYIGIFNKDGKILQKHFFDGNNVLWIQYCDEFI